MIPLRTIAMLLVLTTADFASAGEPLRKIAIDTGSSTKIHCSPDGERIVISPRNGYCVYDLKRDRWINVGQSVVQAVFVSNEEVACFGGGTRYGEIIRVSDQSRKSWGERLENGYWSFRAGVLARVEVPSDDNRWLVDVRRWDAIAPQCRIKLKPAGLFRDVTLSQDGKLVAAVTGQEGIEDIRADIFNAMNGELLQSFVASSNVFSHELTPCCYSHADFGLGGDVIVLAGEASGLVGMSERYESVVQAFDRKTRKERWNHHSAFLRIARMKASLKGRFLAVVVIDVGDEVRLYDMQGARHRHAIRIFDMLTGREIALLTGMTTQAFDIEFDPTETFVYGLAGRDPHLYVWDLRQSERP